MNFEYSLLLLSPMNACTELHALQFNSMHSLVTTLRNRYSKSISFRVLAITLFIVLDDNRHPNNNPMTLTPSLTLTPTLTRNPNPNPNPNPYPSSTITLSPNPNPKASEGALAQGATVEGGDVFGQ